MNAAQQRRYLWEWGQARKWYRAHGLDPKQSEAKRHALHTQALGRDKSSRDLDNGELTKVLTAFRAVYDGGNLDAQLRGLDAPEERRQALIAGARGLAAACVDREGTERAYLDGLAKRMFKVAAYDQLQERQLQQLTGVLTRRKKQLAEAGNPF